MSAQKYHRSTFSLGGCREKTRVSRERIQKKEKEREREREIERAGGRERERDREREREITPPWKQRYEATDKNCRFKKKKE